MVIIKLVLHNYTRVFLNDISHIEYTPSTLMQMILGQNGSGKSSLLEQLTPLPPSLKRDFKEGGYKEITISHNDSVYVLRSENNKHSFIVNDKEINDTGAVSIQLKLVAQHFNITPHIQQILLGKNQFTNMSPSERNKWITDMSNIDYSYPVTVYNRLKRRYRDIVGGIKLVQHNIVRVTSSALPDDLIESLRTDKKHLSTIVDHLLTLMDNTTEVSDVDKDIKYLNKLINNCPVNTSTDTQVNIEDLNNELLTTTTKKDIIDTSLTEQYKRLSELDTRVELDNKYELLAELKNCDDKIARIKNNNKFSNLEDVSALYKYLDSNYSDIVGLLSPLTEHHDIDISNKSLLGLQRDKDQLEIGINNKNKQLHKLEDRLEHLEQHLAASVLTECPKCKYTWNPGDNKDKVIEYKEALGKLRTEISALNDELSTVTKSIGIVEMVRQRLSSFINYFNYSSDCKELLIYINSKLSDNSTNPGAVFSIFESVYKEIASLYRIVPVLNKKEELNNKLELLNNTKDVEQNMVASDRAKINEVIENLRSKKLLLVSRIDSLEKSIKDKRKYMDSMTNIKKGLARVYKSKSNNIIALRNEGIKTIIGKLRSLIIDIDSKLATHTEYVTMLEVYQKELDSLNNREKLLKVTLKEFSPSEGLIAKSISSFLNYLISDMNSIISSIWDYDMELLTCDLGENDLDYKFKVLVNNYEVIEDISKTSSSMQEIINLVFKIVFCRYKGLMDYPLILDEFGRTFDANHRVSAYEALERTLSNDFSQIFMVSHFESMYGRFGNSDVSILGTTGVDMSSVGEYNKVMILS